MRFLWILCLLACTQVYALEAVITVLEAPVFKDRNLDAPIVQYYRKGDVIKIHPSIGNSRLIGPYAPPREKIEKFRNELKARSDYDDDKLFRGEEENTFSLEDQFIPVIDRQGHEAFVLSDHIYVYFNDAREFEQTPNKKDLTDYRLEEPLPKKYPLTSLTGYRGQFLFGVMQPNTESYPYSSKARAKGHESPLEASLTLMKRAPGPYQERLFIGGTMNFRTFENSFILADGQFSTERNNKFGIGPTISYDAFKGEKNRINLSGTILVNLLDRLDITQTTATLTDNRAYAGISLAPRLGLQYHRKQVLPDLDFVLGTSFEVIPATTFRAKNAGTQSSWWQSVGDDKFTTRTTFALGGYVGIQSAY